MEAETTASESLTHPEKVSAVTELLKNAIDVEPGADDSDQDGDDAQAQDDGGAGGGSGELDGQEPIEAESVSDDTEEPEAGDNDTESVTVAALAERLDIDPADVYDLQVPIGEGEYASLGELKDNYKDYGPAKEFNEQLKAREDDFQRRELATKNHFNSMMQVLPAEIREEALQAGHARREEWEAQQVQLTLDAIPEWKDTDTRSKDREAIVALGADYGFTEAEMANTMEARTLRMLRDVARERQELQEMKAQAKKVRKAGTRPAKGRSGKQSQRKLAAALGRAKQSKHIPDKVSAVTQLLNKGK